MDTELLRALLPLIGALEELGIDYQVGGSLASSFHGVPRSSLDVDLLTSLQTDQVEALVKSLSTDYYVALERARDAAKRGGSFNVIHLETMTKLDLFVARLDRFRIESLRRSQQEVLAEGVPRVRMTSAEDIVLHKLRWYKEGGESSRQQWLDVLGVLKVRGETMDRAYLESWSRELSVASLLEGAWSEARDDSSD